MERPPAFDRAVLAAVVLDKASALVRLPGNHFGTISPEDVVALTRGVPELVSASEASSIGDLTASEIAVVRQALEIDNQGARLLEGAVQEFKKLADASVRSVVGNAKESGITEAAVDLDGVVDGAGDDNPELWQGRVLLTTGRNDAGNTLTPDVDFETMKWSKRGHSLPPPGDDDAAPPPPPIGTGARRKQTPSEGLLVTQCLCRVGSGRCFAFSAGARLEGWEPFRNGHRCRPCSSVGGHERCVCTCPRCADMQVDPLVDAAAPPEPTQLTHELG